MHFVTGGHFNGKSQWVRNHYQLMDRSDYTWISAYRNESFENWLRNRNACLIVLEGVEIYLKKMIEKDLEMQQIIEQAQRLITDALNWEQANKNRDLVLIGTDISKGVVPIEKKDRLWRDITGWVYQDIVSKSEKVDVIWYGISRKLK
jgi:adenosylcobinamide kinase/adenosylcobinamide-phosphate guanylyltransferase